MIDKEYSFDEFDSVSFSQWKERISHDQKGVSIDSLEWKVNSEIELSPFHHKDSVSDFTRHNSKFFSSYGPCLNLSLCSSENEEILEALTNGADGVIVKVSNGLSFDDSLRGVMPNICNLSFESVNPQKTYKDYLKWLVHHSFDISSVKGYLFDSNLAGKIKDLSESRYIHDLLNSKDILPGIRFIKLTGNVDGEHSYLDQLANICVELVYYLEKFSGKGTETERIINSLFFQVDSGDNFFLEIAKIRSLNFLSSIILKEYGLVRGTSIPIHVATRPKVDMEQISDCTQTMSALLGGAYSVCTNVDPKEKMKKRISLNVLNILKEESYFDKTINPIEGSYFIESLTGKMIRSAWSLFLEKQKTDWFSSVALSADNAITSKSDK